MLMHKVEAARQTHEATVEGVADAQRQLEEK
jgi:hypothetical protein